MKNNVKLVKCENKNWNDSTFEFIRSAIIASVRSKKICNLMLTGGSTASELYRSWEKKFRRIDYNLNIFLSDERCVSNTSIHSNYFGIINNLYQNCLSPKHNVFPIYNDKLDINSTIDKYDFLLPEFIDISLLSLGVNGHIASIFEQTLNIGIKKLAYVRAPIEPVDRITVTNYYIKKSKKIFLLVKGEEKAEILNGYVKEKLENKCEMPVSFLEEMTILIDRNAYLNLNSTSINYFNKL